MSTTSAQRRLKYGNDEPTAVPPGYKRTEVGVIPQDWDHLHVGDVARVKGGKRLPSGYSLVEARTPHPYIRVTDMHQGGVDMSGINYVPEQAFPAIQRYRIYRNDIFISVAGTLGIVGIVPLELNGANLTENADRITDIRCERDFLMYWLMSQPTQDTIESIRTVGAQPKLALGRIAEFDIALPRNLPEQRDIAGALSDVDGLLGALEALIAKKRAIKQAAMQQLLTGKTRLPGFSGEWVSSPVGDWGTVITGKALAVNGPGQHRPYLRTKNVFDGCIDIADVLTMPMTGDQFSHFMLHSGDVLLNEGQSLDLVGRCAIYQDDYPVACAIQNQLLRFRARAGVSALFASHLFRYSQMTGVFARIALQTTSIAHLGGSRFERLRLPWPKSGAEQHAIATVLSDMDAEIAALEHRHDKTRSIKRGMMQQLLTGRIRLVKPRVVTDA